MGVRTLPNTDASHWYIGQPHLWHVERMTSGCSALHQGQRTPDGNDAIGASFLPVELLRKLSDFEFEFDVERVVVGVVFDALYQKVGEPGFQFCPVEKLRGYFHADPNGLVRGRAVTWLLGFEGLEQDEEERPQYC